MMSYKKYLKNKIRKNPQLKQDVGLWSWLIELGTKVAEIRKTLGYSQKNFADKMGISQTVIARIETGQNMKCSTLWAIGDALEIDLEVFGVSKAVEMEKFEKFYDSSTSQNEFDVQLTASANFVLEPEVSSGSDAGWINSFEPINHSLAPTS